MKKKIIVLINYLILSLALFPIIPNNLKGLPIILLIGAGLFYFPKKQVKWKSFFLDSSLYLLFIISLILGNEIGEAKNKLETSLSIFVLPLLFHLLLSGFNFSAKIKTTFLQVFIISSSMFAIISFIVIYNDSTTVFYSNWYTDKARKVIEQVPHIGQHPIYASIYSSLAIIFSVSLLKMKRRKDNLLLILLLFLNFSFLLLVLSKGVVLSLIAMAFLFVIISPVFKKFRYYIISGLLIILTVLFLFNRRMNELINIKSYSEVNSNYSNSFRLSIYDCSIKVIKESWLLGYGVGNAQAALNKCYKNKSDLLLDKSYNSHNQYLDITLKVGVIGLLFFILFLFNNLFSSFKEGNYLAFYLILFFTFCFLTENILARQTGVILFYFLLLFLKQFDSLKK